jgi:hypothetical protein
MEKVRNAYNILVRTCERKMPLGGDLCVDERIVLKWTLTEY